jgi:CheY-like chemotaxis protein
MVEASRELLLMGIGDASGRADTVTTYLAEAGYHVSCALLNELPGKKPLGIVLDISPFSNDGWGTLLELKKNSQTRDIPILPIYLSEEGKVGGIFPVAGFFILPLENDYLLKKLALLGMTEDSEMWDLQTLIVSRKGEESVAKAMIAAGFDVENAYTGKEAVALASISPFYMAFSLLMLPDMSAFELLEKCSHYPRTRNLPFFVLMKDELKEGEKKAISREIAHLVRKKELSKEEFLSAFRRR